MWLQQSISRMCSDTHWKHSHPHRVLIFIYKGRKIVGIKDFLLHVGLEISLQAGNVPKAPENGGVFKIENIARNIISSPRTITPPETAPSRPNPLGRGKCNDLRRTRRETSSN